MFRRRTARPRAFERFAIRKRFALRLFVLLFHAERRRRLFEPHDRAVQLLHGGFARLKLFHAREQTGAFRALFVPERDRAFPRSVLFERFAERFFFALETGDLLAQRVAESFGNAVVLFEPRFQHVALLAERGELRVDALDQALAVFFQIKEPRNEFQPFRPRRFDKLCEFPLRQRDTFFKIALFQPHDPQQQRVALAHAFGKRREHFTFSFVNARRLHGVFALDLALRAEGTAQALVIDLELEMNVSFFKTVIDDLGKAALRARDVAVERERNTVEHGALARSRIAENPEDTVFGERGKIDARVFGKGIYPAKFKRFRFHRSPLRAQETPSAIRAADRRQTASDSTAKKARPL